MKKQGYDKIYQWPIGVSVRVPHNRKRACTVYVIGGEIGGLKCNRKDAATAIKTARIAYRSYVNRVTATA